LSLRRWLAARISLRNLAMSLGMVCSFLMVKQSFELLEGEGEPVVEIVGSEDAGIEVTFAHDAEVLGSATVLGGGNPFEISGGVVGYTAVEMVALVSLGTRTVESDTDEKVTGFIAEMAHIGVVITSFAVMAMSARSS